MDHPTTPNPDSAASAGSSTSASASAVMHSSRRGFLKVAGAVAASAAAATVGCAPAAETATDARQSAFDASARRTLGFDRPLLNAVGTVMLPTSLGAAGQTRAIDAFVAWVDGYEPVAEEMHGYGYADVRYLPADPAPGWRTQLAALDTLARKMRQKSFVELEGAARQAVLAAALAPVRGSSLPDPLGASHIAIALVSHWAASPAAQDLAMGATVGSNTCRPLDGAVSKPLPIVGTAAGVSA